MSQWGNTKGSMSGRERIVAAIQGKPVDRLPFVPLIDVYTVLDMPAALVEAYETAAAAGYWQGMLQVMRAVGCDILLRHVYVTEVFAKAPHLSGFGQFKSPVEISSRLEGSLLIETLITPIGTLTGTWGFTDRHGWIPHPVKHLVNNFEELQIFHYAVDHLSAEPPAPNYENFRAAEKALGDDGVATTSLLNTPLMHLIETLWGLENTYYLLHDHPAEVEAILEKLHQAQLRVVERVAESPAQVVIEYENTSSTLLSPQVFQRYCLPYLNQHAEILQASGKIFLAHMCGKLNAFVADLADAAFDGICDISPAPTGNLTLDEAAARLPGKILIGGIDATTFIETDSHALETKIAGLIERIKPYPGVLLGSADTAPRGTPVANFRLIQQLVNTLGSYVEGVAETYRPGAYIAALAASDQPAPTQPESTMAVTGIFGRIRAKFSHLWGRREATPAAEAGLSAPEMMLPALQELTRRLDGKRPEVTTTIKFDITDAATYRLIIKEGRCALEAADGAADVTMTIKSKHLLDLFAGKLNPTAAYMTRKLKISGDFQALGVLQSAAE